MRDATELQREYYERTADKYDDLHVGDDEHQFALHVMSSIINYCQVGSVLDVGSGTGRAVMYVKENHPDVDVTGIEPVDALREQGHEKGIEEENLVYGNAKDIECGDGAYDMACAFGVLHHIDDPRTAIEEMLRVSSKAVFISDSNTYGLGVGYKRVIKQAARAMGLWGLLDYINTRGKGFRFSKGDGVSYDYSIFNDVDVIKDRCSRVHFMNTEDGGSNLYRSAGHVAVVGIK